MKFQFVFLECSPFPVYNFVFIDYAYRQHALVFKNIYDGSNQTPVIWKTFAQMNKIRLCICAYVHAPICVHVCMLARVRMRAQACAYTCAHTHIRTHTLACTHARTRAHTHAHTEKKKY